MRVIGKPVFKINKDIDYTPLNDNLSPLAVVFLEQYPEYICIECIGKNQYAFELLINTQMEDNIDWFGLSSNPNPKVIKCLEEIFFDKINWGELSKNPCPQAIDLLCKYPARICFESICQNTNPDVIPIIEANINKIDSWGWGWLSSNSSIGMDILLKYQDKIDWSELAINSDPRAVKSVENNIDKLEKMDKHLYQKLASNKGAIQLLNKCKDNGKPIPLIELMFNENIGLKELIKNENLDRINWKNLVSSNNMFWLSYGKHKNLLELLPFIIKNNKLSSEILANDKVFHHEIITKFVSYDYEKMKFNKKLNRELVECVFNPKRLLKISEKYNVDFIDLVDMY